MAFAYKLLVFDKDGTLGNDFGTLCKWKDSIRDKTLQELQIRGLRHHAGDILDKWYAAIGWNETSQNLIPSAPLATGTWDETLELTAKCLRHVLPDAVDLVRNWQESLGDLHGNDEPLVSDLGGMLRRCKDDFGVGIAVCTSDVRASTDAAIRYWEIWREVDHSVCGDEVVAPKPCAEPLMKVCSLAGVDPKECIMVGDTTHDIIMAKNAGAGMVVGVLSGSGEAQQLRSCGADHILADVSEIPNLLAQL